MPVGRRSTRSASAAAAAAASAASASAGDAQGARKRKQSDRDDDDNVDRIHDHTAAATAGAAAGAGARSTRTTSSASVSSGLRVDTADNDAFNAAADVASAHGQHQHVTPSPAVASGAVLKHKKFAFETPPRTSARRGGRAGGGTGGAKVLKGLQGEGEYDDDDDDDDDDDETLSYSSQRQRQQRRPRLPPGVVDMYSFTTRRIHDFTINDRNYGRDHGRADKLHHHHQQQHQNRRSSLRLFDDRFVHSTVRCEANSANSLSAEFIRSYGEEYLQSLKDSESPPIPYPVSPNSKTYLRGGGSPPTGSGSGSTATGSSGATPSPFGSSQESNVTTASGGSRDSHDNHHHHHHHNNNNNNNNNNHRHNQYFSNNNNDSSDGSSLDEEDFETPPNRKSYIHPATRLKMDGTITRLVRKTNKQRCPVESTDFLMYQPELTPKMRTILVDWLIELSDHFNFSEQTLHQAISMVDMVLACGPLGDDRDEDARDYGEDDLEDEHRHHDDDHDGGQGQDGEDPESSRLTTCYYVSRNRFQLLGATCTWMACKLLEITAPSLSDIAYVSDHIYTVRQIRRMERRVCNALEFRFMSQPTPYLFIHEFVRAGHEGMAHPSCFYEMSLSQSLSSSSSSSTSTTTTPNNVLTSMACYLLELGRMPYSPATRPPSLLAASAVYLSRVTLGIRSTDRSVCPNGWWTPTLEHVTGYNKSELLETVQEIHMYQTAAESSNLKAVYSKYKSRKHHRVSLKTVPLRDDLGI